MKVDDLSGKKVIGVGGSEIGEVKGAEVNAMTWSVTHLDVKLSSQAADQLGYKKSTLGGGTTVCIPVSYVTAVGDVITLNKGISELVGNAEVAQCPQ